MSAKLFLLWLIHSLKGVLSMEVCRSVEGVAITYCEEGFYCCEDNRRCCSSASLGVPAIAAIVIGGVLFIAVSVAFYLLCRKHVPRKPTGHDNPTLELEMHSLELPPPYLLDAYKTSPLPPLYPIQPPPYEAEANTELKSVENYSAETLPKTYSQEANELNNARAIPAEESSHCGPNENDSRLSQESRDSVAEVNRDSSVIHDDGGTVYTNSSQEICTVSVHANATDYKL